MGPFGVSAEIRHRHTRASVSQTIRSTAGRCRAVYSMPLFICPP
jgi:hypothetical protein